MKAAHISANIFRMLGNVLVGGRCVVHGSGYVDADAWVLCGRSELKDDKRDTLLNSRVIVEVLSPLTEEYDRGDNFIHDKSIPTLMHYMLASQDKPFVK